MAGVTYQLLNKRQINNLVNLNNELALSGKLNHKVGLKTAGVSSVSGYYKRCPRCETLGLQPFGINRIEDFRFHGSSSTGCSTYCNSCISSGLSSIEANEAKFLMDEYDVLPRDGELLLRHENGVWLKASEVNDASALLAESLFNYYAEATDLTLSKTSMNIAKVVILGSLATLLGAYLWSYMC